MSLEMTIAAVLLLLVLAVVSWQYLKSNIFVGAKYNQLELQASARSCQAQASLAVMVYDNDYGGNQGDGFADGCDFCLGGDDAKDKDGDAIPDACDNDPQNPPDKGIGMRKVCEEAAKRVKAKSGEWDDKKRQCKLVGIYGTPQGRTTA